MLGPVGWREVKRRLLAAPGAEVGGQIDSGVLAEPARKVAEPQLRVLFPVPVACELNELADSAFARGRWSVEAFWRSIFSAGF